MPFLYRILRYLKRQPIIDRLDESTVKISFPFIFLGLFFSLWSLLCIFGGLCGRLYTIDYLWLPHLLPTHPFVSTFPSPKASSSVVKSVPPTKSGLSSNADDIVGQPQQWKEFTIRVWCSIENRHRLTSFYATR